jgi:hypothetical protein
VKESELFYGGWEEETRGFGYATISDVSRET